MSAKNVSESKWLWQALFFCFVLAGLTGVLYRLGMLMRLPEMLSLQNIRHAHSHLMFFGWAAPLPLYVMWKMVGRDLPEQNRRYRMMKGGGSSK